MKTLHSFHIALLGALGLLLSLIVLLHPGFSAAAPAQPDLTAEINVNPSNPGVNEQVTVSFVVKNLGDAGTGSGFFAYLYVDPPDQPPKPGTVGRPFGFPALGGGQTSAAASHTYTFADAGCHHRIYVWVDRDNQVPEADENNNLVEYQLCVGVACDVDNYEGGQSPWDNARSTASWISPGEAQGHSFCHAQNKQLPDEDWVKFTTFTGLTYTLTAVGQGAHADPQIVLCTTDCNNPLAGPASQVTWPSAGAGVYYARIVNGSGGPNPGPLTAYSLTLTAATGLTDPYEPDDTCASARDIATNGARQSHLFQKLNDADWVRFTIQAGQTFALVTDNPGPGVHPVVSLFSSCTKARDRSVAITSDTGRVELNAPATQTYFVRTVNQNPNIFGATASYDIHVLASNCTADSYEEDDSFTQAVTLTVDAPAQQHGVCPAGDQDWVRFHAQTGTTYILETSDLAASADTELILYGPDGTTPLARNDDFGYTNASRLVWTPSADGTYYAMVRHHSPYAAGLGTEYKLSLKEKVCQPDSLDNSPNPDNGPGDAPIVSTDGVTTTHNFCADPHNLNLGDQDWMRFDAQAGGVYTFYAQSLAPNADPVLEVYAGDGVTLLSSNDDAGPGRSATVVFTATTSGPHFVRVVQYNTNVLGDQTDYRFAAFGAEPPTPTPTPTFTPTPPPTPTPTPTPPPSDAETLILVNRQRFEALYGTARTNSLMNKLQTLANDEAVNGALIVVESHTSVANAYADWLADFTNKEKANAVAAAIRAVVMDFLANGPAVRNVVIVGDDRVIPFRRVTEGALNKQEAAYAGNVTDAALSSLLAANQILTDDYYVDKEPSDWQGNELYLPDYGIGRLIETPEEIMGVIDQFLSEPQINTQRTLVSGYDFIQDSASIIGTMFEADGLNPDRLITSQSSLWSGDEMRALQLNSTTRHELQSINGHSTHVSTGTPDKKDILASEVAAATGNLAGSVVFAVGCHAGLNDPGVLDLPQAWARQKVNYVGNTGYGWGGGGIIYSEALMRNFARELLRDTSVEIGPALAAAKRQYPGRVFVFGAYDAKILMQATLYGMPMLRITSGGALQDEDPFPSAQKSFSPPGFGGELNEGSLSYSLTGAFGENEEPGQGSFADLDGNVSFAAGAPVQPEFFANVSAPAAGTLRGVLFLGGVYTDVTNYDPVIGRPHNEYITDLSEPDFNAAGWWPATPFTLQNSDAISGTADSVVLSLGQFNDDSDTARFYSQMSLSALYSDSPDTTPPVIDHVDGVLDQAAGQGHIKVETRDPSGIDRVVVSFTHGDGTWRSAQIPYDAATLKARGTITGTVTTRFFVQVADKAGNVATDDNKGSYYPLLPPLDLAQGSGVHRIYLPTVER